MTEELGKLIRAARALLGWHQSTLAEQSKVSMPTIWAIETGKTVRRGGKEEGRRPNEVTIKALLETLEDGGVEFTDPVEGVCGPGVRFKWKSKPIDESTNGN